MAERRFTKALSRPGMAAQLRETVSQAVRETAVQNKPRSVEPLDYEDFISKNKTVLHNDSQRDLLLFPADDVWQATVPRHRRTVVNHNPETDALDPNNLFALKCIQSYNADWCTLHYKYAQYGGTYLHLPSKSLSTAKALPEPVYEVDVDGDEDEEITEASVTHEGYLLKGPEGATEKMLANIGTKSFKRRFCQIRQDTLGAFYLDVYKEEKKLDSRASIALADCVEVLRTQRRGKFTFQLRTTTSKSYVFGAATEAELLEWTQKLLQIVSGQGNLILTPRATSEERKSSVTEDPQTGYGTLRSLESSLNPKLMRYARETDLSISRIRKENRSSLFQLYPNLPRVAETDCQSEPKIEPFCERFGQRVLVKCESLTFRLQAPIDGEKGPYGQVEPYMTTMALYDAKLGKKISEDFVCDLNEEHNRELVKSMRKNGCADNKTLEVLNQLSVPEEWLAFPKQAIFSVTNPSPDIFLVVKIETVLQGALSSVLEPYVKSNMDLKTSVKAQKQARAYCAKLGKYRMPFAWSARPLYKPNGELDTQTEFPSLFKQESSKLCEEDLLKSLHDYRKPEKMHRFTIIPGSLKVSVKLLEEILPNTLNCSWIPLDPFPVPPTGEAVFEITEFPTPRVEDAQPYSVYTHNLYVYPKSLRYETQKHFSRARNLACMVQFMDSDAKDARPLPSIYAPPGHGSVFVSQWITPVVHHVTNPVWYDEIKLALPVSLGPKHHLLFTFLHVSCEMSKRKDKEPAPEVIVGYSWLPLTQRGSIVRPDLHSLPVAAHLPPGYLSVEPLGLGKGYSGPEIRWVENQKPLFNVHVGLVSTIVAKDPHLHNFFTYVSRLHYEKHCPTSPLPPPTLSKEGGDTKKALEDAMPQSPLLHESRELTKFVKALAAVDASAIVTHISVILDELFWLLVYTNNIEVSLNVGRVLVHCVQVVNEAGKAEALQAYLKYAFVTPVDKLNQCYLHEALAKCLAKILDSNNTDFLVVHKFLRHAQFFFGIMAKSMAQYLLNTDHIKKLRQERFSASYVESINLLIHTLAPLVRQKYKELPAETKLCNMALAEFLKKCLSLMDRGVALSMINTYTDSFEADDPRVLYEYKFTFMQIVCSHEHYVPLNLPLSCNWRGRLRETEQEFRLSENYCRQHFLAGLLLQATKLTLNEVTDVRKVALRTLRDLLAKHEMDDRYQSQGQQSRIAALYFPWISIVLDNLNRIIQNAPPPPDINALASSASVVTSTSTAKTLKSQSLPRGMPLNPYNWQRNTISFDSNNTSKFDISSRNSSYLALIAGQVPGSSSLLNGSSMGSLDAGSDSTLSAEDASSQCHSNSHEGTPVREPKTHIRNLSTPVVRFDKLQQGEVKEMLLMLLYVLKHVEEEAILVWCQTSSENEVLGLLRVLELCLQQFKYIGKRKLIGLGGGINREPKSSTLPTRFSAVGFGEVEGVQKALLWSNLSTEVLMIVLDILCAYFTRFKESLIFCGGDNALMRKVMDIFVSMLHTSLSDLSAKHVFAALRAYINHFPDALFQGHAWLCGKLCYELLRCCASKLACVRQEACAVLYLLMRSNFEFCGSKTMTRVHLQVIISVSQLLGENVGLNDVRFEESLNVINSFAKSDKAMQSTGFPVEVKDLTQRALTVLRATMQMREQAQDPELLLDLQHSLANSYAATPALRKTWLETMAKHHQRFLNWAEAAFCHIHVAALIAEYLYKRDLDGEGCRLFASKLSPNILRDESNLRLDTGVQDAQFEQDGLLEQLELCVDALEKAELYELQLEVYKLWIPSLEKRRDYNAMAQAYSSLSHACSKVAEVNKSGKRLLGRYYRVAFFGKEKLGDEAGVEYVYKEPKVTSLAEVSLRLQNQFSAKLGPENVKMIMDSNPVVVSTLDPKLAYVQVTHVVPYYDAVELHERVTEFERNHNVNRFMYEVPFTKDGKARGNPEDQWKKRVIITTQYNFPYVKKRIRVIRQEANDLCPIECALDEMRERIKDLVEVVSSQPTDMKKLQLRLQGSISVQVNAGPMAYASVFLERSQALKYLPEHVQQLKEAFRDFVNVCGVALDLNGQLISSDQREYQEALKASYKELVANLSNLLEDPTLSPDWEGSINSDLLKRNSMLFFNFIGGGNGSTSA